MFLLTSQTTKGKTAKVWKHHFLPLLFMINLNLNLHFSAKASFSHFPILLGLQICLIIFVTGGVPVPVGDNGSASEASVTSSTSRPPGPASIVISAGRGASKPPVLMTPAPVPASMMMASSVHRVPGHLPGGPAVLVGVTSAAPVLWGSHPPSSLTVWMLRQLRPLGILKCECEG